MWFETLTGLRFRQSITERGISGVKRQRSTKSQITFTGTAHACAATTSPHAPGLCAANIPSIVRGRTGIFSAGSGQIGRLLREAAEKTGKELHKMR
jgi:hypothetical protein